MGQSTIGNWLGEIVERVTLSNGASSARFVGPGAGDMNRIALLSLATFAVICETRCGRPRDHVYRSRIPGHYAAYTRDRKQPHSSDTIDLNEDGSCVHRFLKTGEKDLTEQSCAWTLTDKLDGTWLRFEGLSNGIHRPCTGDCVAEGAAWDEDFVTRFELPSTPDYLYAK
jgi:hypothetical protein